MGGHDGKDASADDVFEAERPQLLRVATRVLGDAAEAEDVVQQAWLRLHRAREQGTDVENLPAWLTTVTTRLCLDRLKARTPSPHGEVTDDDLWGVQPVAVAQGGTTDPAEHVALADAVGVALHVVLDRLTPTERVAFVLHDSFGIEFATVASVLDTTPAAARKLASRARAKVAQPASEDPLAEWEVVDAFMAAAKGGDLERLLTLLAPGVVVRADEVAVQVGTPAAIDGREAVAAFFDGAAHAALPVYVGQRAGAAWFDRGVARVVFDFTVADGVVREITFRAAPEVLADVVRRRGAERR